MDGAALAAMGATGGGDYREACETPCAVTASLVEVLPGANHSDSLSDPRV